MYSTLVGAAGSRSAIGLSPPSADSRRAKYWLTAYKCEFSQEKYYVV